MYDVHLAVTGKTANGSVTRSEGNCTVEVPYNVEITGQNSFHVDIKFASAAASCGMPASQELDFKRMK
jgi:hypothetical protein